MASSAASAQRTAWKPAGVKYPGSPARLNFWRSSPAARAGSRFASGRAKPSRRFKNGVPAAGAAQAPPLVAAAVWLRSSATKKAATTTPQMIPAVTAMASIELSLQRRHPVDQDVPDQDEETGNPKEDVAGES